MNPSRRRFLEMLGTGAPGALFAGRLERYLMSALPRFSAPGVLLDVIPFEGEGASGAGLSGDGLQGRLVVDLSTLEPTRPLLPNDRFFIRTRASALLPQRNEWTVRVHGRVARESVLSLDDLRRRAQPMAPHLLECSGNGSHRAFGLMSAAKWDGVPLRDLLSVFQPLDDAWGLKVSGFDRYDRPASGSLPGASWIFPLDEIEQSGAFLATGMNGVTLPLDHGSPLRLVVPNWYGCCCIKWVEALSFTTASVKATSQMREFGGRTHQRGTPERAADYRPARIEFAAMPVRVELRKRESTLLYRLLGIAWGGRRRVDRLYLEASAAAGSRERVEIQEFQHVHQTSWNFWSTVWTPQAPGPYTLRARPLDDAIPTQRLATGYYDRRIQVPQV